MIGYVTLGTNDLPRAVAFYDDLLSLLGGKRFMASDRFVAWTNHPSAAGISVALPYDGHAATVGNGVMAALSANDRAVVDQVYARALELGGTDEGAPGERFPGFYAGYFRDLDGNKLNCFVMGKPA